MKKSHLTISEDTQRPLLFMLNSTFPEYSGGRETWLCQVATRLSNKGHDVRILTLRGHKGKLPEHHLPSTISIYRVSDPTAGLFGKMLTPGPLRLLRELGHAWQLRRFFLSKARYWSRKPLVIGLDTLVCPLAVFGLEAEFQFVCASKGPHADVVAVNHPWAKSILHSIEISAYRRCVDLWSNGHDMYDYIAKQGYESIVIGNGVDCADALRPRSHPPEFLNNDAIRVVAVGTLGDIKGISNAICALQKIRISCPNKPVELFFIGKGCAERYRKLARELNVADNVYFLGSRSDVIPYMQHASVLLCLSGGGGQSMAALESLGSCSPVIAWDTPIYRQLISDQINGILVPYNDNSRLAEAILAVARLSPGERHALGFEASKAVRGFDWDVVVDRIEERISLLLESHL